MDNMKKKIKVLSSGIIRVKGFICGPILTPYYEDFDVIYKMITSGLDVVEVADDGAEIKLTVSNIGTDHSSAARKAAEDEAKKKADAEREAAKRKAAEKEAQIAKKNSEEKAPEIKQEHRNSDESQKFNKYSKYQNKYQNKNNNYNKPENTEVVVESSTDTSSDETVSE